MSMRVSSSSSSSPKATKYTALKLHHPQYTALYDYWTKGENNSPSSSDTSRISVMVSGTLSLCFSMTVWCGRHKFAVMEKDDQSRERLNELCITCSLWIQLHTYRCGRDDLLRDHFECVHYRDVTQTSGNRQSCVSILRERQIHVHTANLTCVDLSTLLIVERRVLYLTTVVALGLAPCCSSTLIMCVFPCCAAWWRGVYPFYRTRELRFCHCKNNFSCVISCAYSSSLNSTFVLELTLAPFCNRKFTILAFP